ncbi:GDSL-like lipase/acylhydrolase family protein [Prauserella shujinwangii]|uniref:GDSL-like lipase/acylhydrolase family protein n=1 Tax=Prauserella shujinwangii TaxID=1453103 RepID=A0A2T0LP82_9PSEU|nr:GDSL-type esterase/lipase family protein [Prauserella shujinwangii]PRX45043.1 GDSL-like lipase/acylhydrolase family protein [Prauserella shujinwangii]
MLRLRWWLGAIALVGVAALVAVFVIVGDDAPGPVDPPGPPGTGPLTIVSMGDSTLSGEGAGDYTPATDGKDGNWCHRSPHAEVHQIELPGITESVNFACSGAPSAHVALGDVEQWTEPSQSQQLAELTETHRVAAVVVAVGANDDPQFSRLISECFTAWFMSERAPCSDQIKRDWQARIDAMVPKVAGALKDIRKVLRDRGYSDEDYELVLQSYAAPIGPDMPERLRNLDGCPFRKEDLHWISDGGTATLSAGLRTAAEQAGARFLDLSRAGRGHQACSGGDDPSSEWFTRFTVQWDYLKSVDRASHALAESFHPNARGHAQFARCVSEFLVTDDDAAACLEGEDGNLHPARSVLAG